MRNVQDAATAAPRRTLAQWLWDYALPGAVIGWSLTVILALVGIWSGISRLGETALLTGFASGIWSMALAMWKSDGGQRPRRKEDLS
jgi:hypothetical protein